MSNCIYTVLVCSRLDIDPKDKFPDTGSDRIVGYFFDKDEAFHHVMNNDCDIWEYTYDYAIIERVEPGFYESAGRDDRWFFKFNHDKCEYERIDEPESYEHFSGFTIG